MAYTLTNSAPIASALDQLATLTATLKTRAANRRRYNETVRELSKLSNWDLADLGLHRAGIKSVALKATYGDQY